MDAGPLRLAEVHPYNIWMCSRPVQARLLRELPMGPKASHWELVDAEGTTGMLREFKAHTALGLSPGAVVRLSGCEVRCEPGLSPLCRYVLQTTKHVSAAAAVAEGCPTERPVCCPNRLSHRMNDLAGCVASISCLTRKRCVFVLQPPGITVVAGPGCPGVRAGDRVRVLSASLAEGGKAFVAGPQVSVVSGRPSGTSVPAESLGEWGTGGRARMDLVGRVCATAGTRGPPLRTIHLSASAEGPTHALVQIRKVPAGEAVSVSAGDRVLVSGADVYFKRTGCPVAYWSSSSSIEPYLNTATPDQKKKKKNVDTDYN